ncbi:hypothetical protein FHR93_001279 [Geodermatophilus sabuli]|uniref:Uncharacterized protein n=1 Tax=Geodermatophilus sabuli TaxID=1564158 RepID=A0A285EIS1_9ACTN|nr:hypothetical protein [Geodermatophilus sabuli]MBB3083098.1 hypothetical protein [Geodermatophilus sabuli]SNX98094.1 hypothetical protein SAMN06893097_109174 [Geodermatophilus sabuli]
MPAAQGELFAAYRCGLASTFHAKATTVTLDVSPQPASRPLTDTAPEIGGPSLSAAAARRVSPIERVDVTCGTYHLIRDIPLPGNRSGG